MSGRAAWFAPKRFGYGAGLPICWQGWAVLAVFAAALALSINLLSGPARVLGVLLLATLVTLVAWRTTDGEWRWRWPRR